MKLQFVVLGLMGTAVALSVERRGRPAPYKAPVFRCQCRLLSIAYVQNRQWRLRFPITLRSQIPSKCMRSRSNAFFTVSILFHFVLLPLLMHNGTQVTLKENTNITRRH